nr:MAG TPA: hypothetical protein [Caudoviricetes sp.]
MYSFIFRKARTAINIILEYKCFGFLSWVI